MKYIAHREEDRVQLLLQHLQKFKVYISNINN